MGTGTYFSDTVKRNTSRSRSRRRRRGGPTGPLRKWTLPISTSPNSKTVLVIRLLGFGRKSSQFVAETKVSTMGVARGTHPPGVEDRKSTRLNSSHLGISYAVFCLKKKKKTKIQIQSRK